MATSSGGGEGEESPSTEPSLGPEDDDDELRPTDDAVEMEAVAAAQAAVGGPRKAMSSPLTAAKDEDEEGVKSEDDSDEDCDRQGALEAEENMEKEDNEEEMLDEQDKSLLNGIHSDEGDGEDEDMDKTAEDEDENKTTEDGDDDNKTIDEDGDNEDEEEAMDLKDDTLDTKNDGDTPITSPPNIDQKGPSVQKGLSGRKSSSAQQETPNEPPVPLQRRQPPPGTIQCFLCGGVFPYPGPRFANHLLHDHGIVFDADFFIQISLHRQRTGQLPNLEILDNLNEQGKLYFSYLT